MVGSGRAFDYISWALWANCCQAIVEERQLCVEGMSSWVLGCFVRPAVIVVQDGSQEQQGEGNRQLDPYHLFHRMDVEFVRA